MKTILNLILTLSCFCVSPLFAQLDKVEKYYLEIEKSSKDTPPTLTFIQEDMQLVEDYSKLSQIILIRHGEPALDKKGWRKRKQAMQFVKDYDSVGIYPPAFIPLRLEDSELGVIHTSSINRSISTSEQVFSLQGIQAPSPMFREFERKIISFPNIKLPLKLWLGVSRISWLMGLNDKGIECFRDARSRAKEATEFLEHDAETNSKTLLVSHGLLNHFLVKYLKKNG
ncbi:MAG: histidine phosphatase family protein [Bacteroidota bacterium]